MFIHARFTYQSSTKRSMEINSVSVNTSTDIDSNRLNAIATTKIFRLGFALLLMCRITKFANEHAELLFPSRHVEIRHRLSNIIYGRGVECVPIKNLFPNQADPKRLSGWYYRVLTNRVIQHGNWDFINNMDYFRLLLCSSLSQFISHKQYITFLPIYKYKTIGANFFSLL